MTKLIQTLIIGLEYGFVYSLIAMGMVLVYRMTGVVHIDKPRSAQAVDVVPTVLYIAGLPVGRDMDGSVLSEAFSEELLRSNPLSLVQTYEAQQLVVRRSGT